MNGWAIPLAAGHEQLGYLNCNQGHPTPGFESLLRCVSAVGFKIPMLYIELFA